MELITIGELIESMMCRRCLAKFPDGNLYVVIVAEEYFASQGRVMPVAQ